MSCSANNNKAGLVAVRCGISRTANKTLGLMVANKDVVSFGAAAGGLSFAGKLVGDQIRTERQTLVAAAYTQQLQRVARLATDAAKVRPELRPPLLRLAQNRLDGLKQVDYAGLPASMRQEFARQHQVVDTWLKRVAAASAATEDPLTREFVTGAARAGNFGMKNFSPPTPPSPSLRATLQTAVFIGAVAGGLFAANKIAARRRQNVSTPPQTVAPIRPAANIAQKPVKNSSFVAAAGYDQNSQTLRVTFKSGSSYDYHGVPAEVAQGFLAADKKGGFFHHQIKGVYRVRRLEPAP
jgi:hypothetical protein